jgi:hypothetical protein
MWGMSYLIVTKNPGRNSKVFSTHRMSTAKTCCCLLHLRHVY